ncbi:MAG TPA: HD domain-containing phosphohydrolase [Blastocatellia bacterium]
MNVKPESPSILIVDDDRAVRGLLKTYLGSRYNCTTASDADEATAILERKFFHVVVTDITMPFTTGLDLCHLVSRMCPDTVVIIVSANGHIEYAAEAMRQGCFDYITKPFDLVRVGNAVDRALRYQEMVAARNQRQHSLEEKVQDRTNELTRANQKLNVLADTVSSTYRSTFRSLASILEARDLETRGHSDRVVAYSIRLAKELGLNRDDLIGLEQGALLHDIGKIGVRDSVLLKQGPLNADEQVVMREHVAHGLRIIEGMDFMSGAGLVIGQHHEKYDGTGYPRGLSGNDIHLNARIFAVADAYDAITSDRPYRAAKGYLEACQEIRKNAGMHFDPSVVDAYFGIRQSDWTAVREQVQAQRGPESSVSKEELRSFILSLHCPDELSGKLAQLCA